MANITPAEHQQVGSVVFNIFVLRYYILRYICLLEFQEQTTVRHKTGAITFKNLKTHYCLSITGTSVFIAC